MMQREQILRELELLYVYLFQQILYTVTVLSYYSIWTSLFPKPAQTDPYICSNLLEYLLMISLGVPSKILTYGKPGLAACCRRRSHDP